MANENRAANFTHTDRVAPPRRSHNNDTRDSRVLSVFRFMRMYYTNIERGNRSVFTAILCIYCFDSSLGNGANDFLFSFFFLSIYCRYTPFSFVI